MIDIRHVSQQLELTFWHIAIESMSTARSLREKLVPGKFHSRFKNETVLVSLALSGLGMSLGFLIGFTLL